MNKKLFTLTALTVLLTLPACGMLPTTPNADTTTPTKIAAAAPTQTPWVVTATPPKVATADKLTCAATDKYGAEYHTQPNVTITYPTGNVLQVAVSEECKFTFAYRDQSNPPAAPAATAAATNRSPDPACVKLASDYKNRPHPEDAKWMACFLTGDVNWVFAPDDPLPLDAPKDVRQALTSGKFVKLVEPWRPGCDNSMSSPDCNIGYLKLFSDWGTMFAFTRVGETRPNVKGPWTMGSLWVTPGPLVQMSPGVAATDEEKRLLCNGLIEWNFSENYPLPTTSPCASDTLFTLQEPFRGGCIGRTDDKNCNVGFAKQYNWSSLLTFLKDGNWSRGSVWVPRK